MNYDINLDLIAEYNTHDKILNVPKSALVVIEMQEIFRSDMKLISDNQINNVKHLLQFAQQNKMEIIYVRHNDSSDYSQNMINWWGDKLEFGSSGWRIIPELYITNSTIIDKSQYSAFYNTNLHEILQSKGVEDIVICGLMTNCCCETAARDAFMRGYNVFFVNDATSTINADLHLAAIKNIAFGFGKVINTNELQME